jgi:DNA-binding HxlR family transcriptional regulator
VPLFLFPPGRRKKTREALRGLVEHGILEVTKPHRDPLKAEYRMLDPEGVRRALAELEEQT